MSLVNYVALVIAALSIGWILVDLQNRVRDLERRMDNHQGPVQ